MAVQGSVIGWVADHRRHHAFADREGDPHSPWLFGTSPSALAARVLARAHGLAASAATSTNADPFRPRPRSPTATSARSTAYFPLWIALSLALPAVLGGLISWSWWGALTAFFWAGLVRVALLHHVTWSVNSICHMIGDAPVRQPRQGRQLLAAGHPVHGRVVAQLPPRRPDLRPPRRAARPDRHLRPGHLDLREASAGPPTSAGPEPNALPPNGFKPAAAGRRTRTAVPRPRPSAGIPAPAR